MRKPIARTAWVFDPQTYGPDDAVAYGADLEPGTLIEAYSNAAFPMPHDDGIMWWSPLARGVLRPDQVLVSKSLRKSMKRYSVTVNKAFEQVITACGDPRRDQGWIDSQIVAAYMRLHELGWAHSVETWHEGALVGGLYGVSIGQLFAGESMFHTARDASKVALVELTRIMAVGLIDTQWSTPHLASLGVREWPRSEYLDAVRRLIRMAPPSEFE